MSDIDLHKALQFAVMLIRPIVMLLMPDCSLFTFTPKPALCRWGGSKFDPLEFFSQSFWRSAFFWRRLNPYSPVNFCHVLATENICFAAEFRLAPPLTNGSEQKETDVSFGSFFLRQFPPGHSPVCFQRPTTGLRCT